MKIVQTLSGGMDSATLLYHLLDEGHEVKALCFNYGQRHSRELEYAKKIAASKGVEIREINLSSIKQLLGGSSQTDASVEVPYGNYDEENMKKTVVPNRNMIMLAIACAWAVSLKYDAIVFGAHAGDHAIYPDCREEFIQALSSTMEICDWHPVKIYAPFSKMTKGDIAKRGLELGVPFQLTWTCYEGKEVPCGKCGACSERKEAFEFAGVADPLLQ
jgi:7-cyano-7-deazaguanine synthase